MGSSSSKAAAPKTVNGLSTQTNISEVSSGTHLIEIHMPSAGMGIGFVIAFVLISLALYTCHWQCRRCTRPRSRRRQAAYSLAAPTYPLAPLAPIPASPPVYRPDDPMQALVLFAQLQQQQQPDIAALTDELRLISSRPRFSVLDETVPASPTSSAPSTSAPTVPAASPALLSLGSISLGSTARSPARLTAAPVL